jgi:hypothetical protein
MAKRAVREKEILAEPEESEFKHGVVCFYYDDGRREGWRAGTIESTEVDDDGDLLVTLTPVSKGKKVRKKSQDLKL